MLSVLRTAASCLSYSSGTVQVTGRWDAGLGRREEPWSQLVLVWPERSSPSACDACLTPTFCSFTKQYYGKAIIFGLGDGQ